MKKNNLLKFAALLMIVFLVVACDFSSFSPATPTAQPTYTPLPTFTPLPTATFAPTETPIPSPTPKPTIKDVLEQDGFTFSQSYTDSCAVDLPCKAYALGLNMEGTTFASGQFRLSFIVTPTTASQMVRQALDIVKQIFGQETSDWFSSQLDVAGDSYKINKTVVNGHWIGVGAKKLPSGTNPQVLIILAVSPDENAPIGFTIH